MRDFLGCSPAISYHQNASSGTFWRAEVTVWGDCHAQFSVCTVTFSKHRRETVLIGEKTASITRSLKLLTGTFPWWGTSCIDVNSDLQQKQRWKWCVVFYTATNHSGRRSGGWLGWMSVQSVSRHLLQFVTLLSYDYHHSLSLTLVA